MLKKNTIGDSENNVRESMPISFKIEVAKKNIEIRCSEKKVFALCKDYLSEFKRPDITVAVLRNDVYEETKDIIDWDDILNAQQLGIATNLIGFESIVVHRKISEAMLNFNIILLHGAAIAVGNRCYVFTAPSGTGKTTHVKKWLKKIPGSFIVNGDKPYIDVKKKLVYGSPWCGKEGMNTNTSIPLCGIISLERGEMNNITLISYQEMLKVYLQQVYIPDDPETAVKAYQLIGMLKNVPCYRLICNMEEESAQVAYQGLCGDYDRELFI